MMRLKHFTEWILICFILFISFYCDNPSGLDHDRENDVYWTDLAFYPLLPNQYNDSYVWIVDTTFNYYQNEDDTTLIHLYTSLGDREDIIAHYEESLFSYGNRIETRYSQTYQEMDNILQLSPKNQEGWILIKYYLNDSNQICYWRIVWEIE